MAQLARASLKSESNGTTTPGVLHAYDAGNLSNELYSNEQVVVRDSLDAAGNMYFMAGNGDFDANTGGSDYGESFEKIGPSGAVVDYFTPHDQVALSAADLDLGSGGVLLLPDQGGANPHEMLGAGKNGTIYLLDRDNMGQYNPIGDFIVQSIVGIFTQATGIEGGNFSSPVYFNVSAYFGPVSDNVQAFSVSNGLLSTSPTSRTATVYGQRGATMAILANGNAGGILWSLDSNGTGAPGVLHAYEAGDLGNALYNSTPAGSRDTLDAWYKSTVPKVANGKVLITSVSQLTVYGLMP